MSELEEFQFRRRQGQEQGLIDRVYGPESEVFPEAAEMPQQGLGQTAKKLGTGVMEVLDYPKRKAAELDPTQSASEPGAYLLKRPVEALQKGVKEQLSKGVEQLAGLKSDKEKLKSQGLSESEVDEAIGQVEKLYSQFEGVSRFVGETISDPTFWAAPVKEVVKKLKKPIGSILTKPGKLFGEGAEYFGMVDEDVMRKWGLGYGKGAKELKGAFGAQYEIGRDLVRKLDNIHDYIPEGEVVKKIISEMPEISTDNLKTALQNAKIKNPVEPGARSANRQIDKMLEPISDKMSAKDFRDLRIQFDNVIPEGRISKKYIDKAYMKARKAMKNDLIEVAEMSGVPGYSDVMKNYAEKLDLVSTIKGQLGKTPQAQKDRAEGYISNIMNLNKTERQNTLKKFDDLFGEDFSKRAKLAAQSKQLTKRGKMPIGPNVATGARLGGLIPVLGSPKLSSAILGTVDSIEKAVSKGLELKAVSVGADLASAVSVVSNALQNLTPSQQRRVKQLSEKYNKTKDPKMKKIIERNLNKYIKAGK